jgi:Bacterial regulatory proteins, luxR family
MACRTAHHGGGTPSERLHRHERPCQNVRFFWIRAPGLAILVGIGGIADSLGNHEIAEQLNLSEHTVKNYMFHIFDKLGISNRVELVLYAMSSPNGNKASSSRKEPAIDDSAATG